MFHQAKTETSAARQLLSLGMNRFQLKLNRDLITDLLDEFQAARRKEQLEIRKQLQAIPKRARKTWLEESGIEVDNRSAKLKPLRRLLGFLVSYVSKQLECLKQLKRQSAEFRNAISVITSADQREEILLTYTRVLGLASRADRRALKLFLNDEAVNDCFIRLTGEAEQRVAFATERLGHVAAAVLEEIARSKEGQSIDVATEQRSFWGRVRIEPLCKRVLVYEGDPRVNLAGLKCISRVISDLPMSVSNAMLSDATHAFLQSASLDRTMDVWLQCESQSILAKIAPAELLSLIHLRLTQPGDGDDMFVRRHCVTLLAELCRTGVGTEQQSIALAELLRIVSKDKNAFVRQQVVVAAVEASPNAAQPILENLALRDQCEKVRAGTLIGMLESAKQPALQAKLLELIHAVLCEETDEFVVRTALYAASRWIQENTHDDAGDSVFDYFQRVVVPDMLRLESSGTSSIPVRRWSAQARERVWMALNSEASKLRDRLTDRVHQLAPGKAARIPRAWLRNLETDLIGRVLAVMAQDDFGYDLEKTWLGYRIVRGPVFRFRFWRFWFELFNRAPDKRQAFQHTIGRWSEATIRAPSQIMGELSQTKVPGEPYLVASDGTWRPFLPLVDDLVSALQLNWFYRRPIRFYSSQGITEVFAPKSWLKKISATWRLTFQFPKFAQLRNWDSDPQRSASAYLEALQQLGFTFRLRQHTESPNAATIATATQSSSHDPSVLQFFPCVAMLAFAAPDVQRLAREYVRYFGSAYENTLGHLVIFVSLFLLFFVLKHFLSNIALRRARLAIPLSLGGWGTRGKSGTERLKAALIGAMGHGLVSKTTGCEAMFIQAHAFGEPLEIPLFRPNDKATIWEQANILKLAAELKPAVFLWECMGLTPSYVEVLSRQWTCDDMATITNTYPDHEDLQGPAGYDVATTISGFVPRNSHLITTEEEMRPLVTESCRRVGTTLRGVGWLESGLITDDVQDRFAYKEHPDNIALVAAMGDELGVPYEFAVKAMADNLIPDLGVLKVYPVSHVRKRRIEFTNGMSANERFGCMGNWKRLGYDKCHPDNEPDTWVTAVINNRDDRVARSRVFASIMVNDIAVDRFFLIGSNLSGLQGFVEEAWQDREKQFRLCGDNSPWSKEQATNSLMDAAEQLRQPTSAEHVRSSLRAMLKSCVEANQLDELVGHWESPDAVLQSLESHEVDASILDAIKKHHIASLQSLDEYKSLEDRLARSSSSDADALNSQFQEIVRTWFMRKRIVLEDYDATGEEVVAAIVDETPPGFLNRTMGMQNIKGTGLDFIYRFQAWDTCFHACQQLKGDSLRAAEKGLQTLLAMPVIGQLCKSELGDTISVARDASHLQRSDIQSGLASLEKKMNECGTPNSSAVSKDSSRFTKAKSWFCGVLEQFFDANDAISRRRFCDQIYEELKHGRISRQAAVESLRRMNKRQKGGWLK